MIVRLSGGSPFMASAMLRGLVETGALVAGPEGWQVDDSGHGRREFVEPGRRLPGSTSGTAAPKRRSSLLSAGAVLGKEFDLEIVSELAGQTSSEAIGALNEARQRCLVWLGPGRDAVHLRSRQDPRGPA